MRRGNLFYRARKFKVFADGKEVFCRGVVQKLREDKTAAGEKTETFGGAVSPLYVYFGDGRILCGAKEACLAADGVLYRVLYAQEKRGFCGESYVRAVLERGEDVDG